MLRKSFLVEHGLQYERYAHAEDYKLWFEVAKCGGEFYIIPSPLLRYRISPEQVTQQNGREQKATAEKIRQEIRDYLQNQ
jgi:hypothetical protein